MNYQTNPIIYLKENCRATEMARLTDHMEVYAMAMDVVAKSNIGNDYSTVSQDVKSAVTVEKKQPVIVEDAAGIKVNEDGRNQSAEKQTASPKSVEDAVKRANNKMSTTHCEFSYNENVNRVSITVYDDVTGEVVREIPPEESLKMLEKMWEITGLMVDEKR